ncbi:MAG: protein-glutamate O-methyltransferase CheR [Acidobacteria bacterium]|nr:protein-glutamate O-methyltransferase CheR [Acidobacteriota bacterium]
MTGTGQLMSPSEHKIWRQFIENRCGIDFGETRLQYLCRRLSERMRALNITGFHRYYTYLNFNAEKEQEWPKLLELLVVGETSFFRHEGSFLALRNLVIPGLIARKQQTGSQGLTMWSAGCSTGQEAYSMTMTALDLIDPQKIQVETLGTDINTTVLEKARTGKYSPLAIRSLPAAYRKKYLTELRQDRETIYQVNQSVRDGVQFGHHNLKTIEHNLVPGQDVIFCQNALIYFTAEFRPVVVQALCQCLNPGGFLFLAPGEIVGFKLPGIQSVKAEDSLVFQRL